MGAKLRTRADVRGRPDDDLHLLPRGRATAQEAADALSLLVRRWRVEGKSVRGKTGEVSTELRERVVPKASRPLFEKVRWTLMYSVLPYVVSRARIYARHAERLEAEDFFQAGMIGVMRAVELYEIDHGTKFLSYASFWVSQGMRRLRDYHDRLVKIPLHVDVETLPTELRRRPLDLVAIERWTPEVLEAEHGPTKRWRQGEDHARTLAEFREAIEEELLNGPYKFNESQAVIYRYGLFDSQPGTLDETGERMGVTRERVRQLEVKAFEKLRYRPKIRALAEELGYSLPEPEPESEPDEPLTTEALAAKMKLAKRLVSGEAPRKYTKRPKPKHPPGTRVCVTCGRRLPGKRGLCWVTRCVKARLKGGDSGRATEGA
jgi:RNA polymerase sigma factor (sigma-70 family)